MRNKINRRDLLRGGLSTSALLPSTLLAQDTALAIRREGLAARQFGVLFDGRSDDAAALQRGIDEAARQQRPLVLPSGTARIGSSLDLKGRHVSLVGDPAGHSILQAGKPLRCMIDGEETREVIDSPLYIYGLSLDGAGVAATGLMLRYRHRTVFDTLAVERCGIGIDENDTWLSRRINCRTRATRIGWRLRGSNHSSVWLGCTFTDAQVVHLDIGATGTADDGNDALLFQGCDIEYGEGHGIVVAKGATATFDTCYLGEGIGGDVLRSAGTVSVRGGALFVGHRPKRTGIVPLGGRVNVSETSVRGQQYGFLDRLVGSSAGETSRDAVGKVIFRDVNMQLMLGGDPVFSGDVLGTMPMRVFAPILGRAWRATAHDATIAETGDQNERTVRCRAVTGENPLIGLAAPLRNKSEARRGGAIYLVVVYSATKPVELKFTAGPISRAPWRPLGTLPATKGLMTYVKADVPMMLGDYATVEFIMRADVGDALELHHVTISDSAVLEPGPMANLAKAQ